MKIHILVLIFILMPVIGFCNPKINCYSCHSEIRYLPYKIPSKYIEDAAWLAKNIYFEANTESVFGKIAVTHTVLNRVKNKYFPNNIYDNIWKRKQFSWTHDGKSDKIPSKKRLFYYKRLAYLAILLYNDGIDFSNGANFYHANYKNPYWNKTMIKTAIIGKHIFYRRG